MTYFIDIRKPFSHKTENLNTDDMQHISDTDNLEQTIVLMALSKRKRTKTPRRLSSGAKLYWIFTSLNDILHLSGGKTTSDVVLEAKVVSRPKFWPRPRGFGLDLVVLLCNRAYSVQKSCKIWGILLIFSAIILNHMLLIITYLVLFHNYFWPRPRPWPYTSASKLWPQPSKASASRFWPRLTSLNTT